MMRKALAWLLTLMMVISILPMSVFATEEATAEESGLIIGDDVVIIDNEEPEEPADEIELNEAQADPTSDDTTYVAYIGTQGYESVIEALTAAVNNSASEVKILQSVREKMPTDIELVVNADLIITADSAVDVKFYNDGTNYDFIFNSNNNNTITIGENVTFQLEERVIWLGYYGNNVDVVVNGTLAGYQIWHGADTTVNSTGTIKSTGEAFVMRRGATLTVDGGKVDANYFNILAGNIFAENATIDCGAFWIANTGSYTGEGNVSINIGDSTLTSSGNLKSSTDHSAGVSIDIYDSTVSFNDFDGYGASVLDENTVLAVNGENAQLNVKSLTNNGTIDVYDGGKITATGTVTNNGTIEVENEEDFEGAVSGNQPEVPAPVVAKIGTEEFTTFDAALTAANALTGDVTVKIYGKVEYTDASPSLTGAYDSIRFVGKTADAEISITRNGSNGYISGVNNDCDVTFTDLILSKPAGFYANDAGDMNVAFTVYRVGSVSYTNCTFLNGACAAGCPTTYTGCTFKKSHDKYALWAYGTSVKVTNCVFDDDRGIKMYAEGAAKTTSVDVSGCDFSKLTSKPAIVATLGNSITLSGNTYSAKGVLELEDNGSSNGIAISGTDNVTCISDAYPNGCGVLVDGKIYRTVADAAAVAEAGDTVTLLHNSTETVKLPEGVILDKNGFEAAGVTVAQPATPVAYIGETPYTSLQAAINAAAATDTIVVMQDVKENITSLKGNIVSGVAEGVTITSDYESWVYCGNDFTIGEGVTFKTAYMFAYCKNGVINGTVELSAQLYMRYAGAKLTINAPGKLIITGENAIIRYMEGDIEAGIYINGDNDDSTVEFKAPYISFYSGIISAKDAVIETGVLWQTNSTDSAEHGAAYLKLDNSKLNMTVYEHTFKADDNSKIELINGSAMNIAGNYQVADTVELVVDATSSIKAKNYTYVHPVAKIGETKYESLEDAFAAAVDGATITLLADATPVLKSQSAITKASVIDLGGKTLTLTEDDLYFGTTTFKNGTIVVDPSVKASTAVFWMFANQTLTFDNVKIVATGVSGTYLIGLDGNNSDLNLLNGSEILVENTTALDLDIICVNASTGNDIVIDNSKVNVTNLDGRVFFRGNYTVKGESEIVLEGITKAGFRIEAGQTLSIEDTSEVTITGEPRDGGIHLTDTTATYTKADTATVNATVNKPTVAQIGDTPYESLADALAAAKAGDEIVLLADATVEGTVAIPAGVTIKSNGHTINGSIRMLGDLNLNGALTITGGLWVGKSGETMTATLSGDKLTASYFMFQRGIYTINTDIDAVYGYLSFEGTFEVNSTIHTTGANGEVLYINGNVTLNDGAVLDSDNSVFLSNDAAVLTMKPGSKVDSNLNITASGAKLRIDATGLTAGEYTGITGTVTNSGNGTIEVVENDKLEAKIVDGKIVLAAKPVAKIGDTPYTTLEDAFKAATSGCTIEILADVTIDYTWNCRSNNGAQFTVPVTINGNGKTIKFTGEIKDNNWNTVFRFEENATVKNLKIDISEATSVQRVITAKKSLTVDGLTIIGSARYGIIFGEGASAKDLANAEIVIKNSTLTGTRRAISDNEGGKDVKSVVVTGNTLNANVAVSASESITFNNNTAAGEVDLRSYSAENVLSVEAKGNTLNPAAKNYIYAKTIDAQDEFITKNPPIKVSTKAELNAALAAAKDGDTIVLTADIDYGTDQLKIEKAIVLDLGGKTLTTRNAYGGMSVKGNPTIKNGTIVHASNTAAIKVWNATAFENLVIDVQGKGDANKTIGGIVLQSGSTTRVGSIKNVTIKGAALTNGIETYNCGDATENVIGSLENVNIEAVGTGMLISALCGTATNCSIKGGTNAIELWIKGTYSASLTLEDCDVVGGVSVHDEFNSADITNNGTLTLNTDDATTGVTEETVTLTINHAEETQVKGEVLETIIEKAQAKVNGTYYKTLADAINAAQAGDTIVLLKDLTLDAPITVKKSITIDGNGKKITQSATCNNNIALLYFEGAADNVLEVTVKNVTFDGLKVGAAIRTLYANINIDNCVFQNCEHTVGQGLVRLTYGDATIKNSKFLNNNCSMGVSFNWDADGSQTLDDTLTIDNCEFTGNTANKTALVYYVKGVGCEIKNSEFVNNKVNTANNCATIYLGFTENNVVTGNLFKDNTVTDSSTSTRVAGAIFFGYESEISRNAFINNTASNANGDTLGQICTSTYYDCDIDLSGNYWGGEAPVYGKDYTVQHQTGDATFALDTYYASYTTDTDGNVVVGNEVTINNVAQVGKFGYTSLADAINAAQAGDTITLLAPVVVAADETLTLDKAVTITYTSDVPGEDMITNRGTLVIDGVTLVYTNTDTTATNVTVSTISTEPGSTLEVKSGTVKNDSANNGALGIYAFAIDILTNGTLGDVTATISGGEVISTNYMAIRQFNNGTACKNTLTITGGEIYGAKRAIQVHLKNDAAYLAISGGKIEAGEGGYALCLFPENATHFSVTGGKFVGTIYSGTNGFISGGTFDAEPYAGYAADGYKFVKNADGKYGVTTVAYVAEVNGTKYESLQAAVEAAQPGDTIKFIANFVIDGATTITETQFGYETLVYVNNKNITIDFNGYTAEVTPAAPDANGGIEGTIEAVIFIGNGGKLTLKDSSTDAKGGFKVNKGTTDLYSLIYNCEASLVIENGNYYVEKTIETGSLIYADAPQTTVVYGGTFTLGNASTYIESTKPWIFNVEGKNASFIDVMGGTYNQDILMNYGTQKDCEARVPNTKAVKDNGNGTWTIVDAVACIGDADGYNRGFATLAAALTAAQAGDKIELLADAAVDGTVAIPAGVTIKSNGHTIYGSIRMLGDLTLNGPLTITGGLWVGKSGETLTATLSGDKLTASYFMFQRGTYTINADIDAVYGYLSFEGTFEVNSTIHTTGANGEVLYINGNVTLNDGAVLDSDNSVFLSNDAAVLTMKPGSKVDSKLSITKPGAKLVIDATGLTAGEYTGITGTVTNNGNGTIEVINNDALTAEIKNGKIVLVEAAKVAEVNGVQYATLQAAINAANGAKITLIAHTTEVITISADATVIIDLGGKTLNGYIAPCDPAALTVTNGNIVNTNAGASAIEINAGELTLTNVNVTSARHGVRIDGAVTATIISGEYRVNATSGTRHAVNISGTANVTIKGGTFVGPKGTTMDSGSAVCVQTGATVTIEGGNFSGGKNATLGVSGTLSITGGTFDQDPSAYVANGYVAIDNGDGTWTVEEVEELVVELSAIEASYDAEVQLWMYFIIPDELINDDSAYVSVVKSGAWGDVETIITMAELREAGPTSYGDYKIIQGIASGEMGRNVTVKFVDGNGNVVKIKDYVDNSVNDVVTRSIIDYATRIFTRGTEKQKKMVVALLTYGGYAQLKFNVDANDPVYNILTEYGYEIPTLEDISASSIAQEMTINGTNAGINFTAQEAYFDSAIYHRVFFKLDANESISNFKFEVSMIDVNGNKYVQEVDAQYDSRYDEYYIDILDIPAAYLDYMYKITVTNTSTNETYEVTTSVLVWAKLVIEKSADVKQINLAKAAYYYNAAANVFFGK